MSDAGNFQWDMMEGDSSDVFNPERQAYLEDLGENCAKVPKAYSDGARGTCYRFGILPGFGVALLTANKEAFEDGKVPSNWKEFWDVDSFPGPRALQNFGTPWRVLVGALVADGVPKDKLFPLDLDRAFKKLNEIRPHVAVWWSPGDQIQRAFRDGEVVAGLIWGTRLGAIRFLNWYFDHPESQYAFAKAGNLAPSTKSALSSFPPKTSEPADPSRQYRRHHPNRLSMAERAPGRNPRALEHLARAIAEL